MCLGRTWTVRDVLFLKDNYNTATYEELESFLDRSMNAIHQKAFWMGYKRKRKVMINNEFFKVWSRDMAYVLGFVYAEGCITGLRALRIKISHTDEHILRDICSVMKCNYIISYDDMYNRVNDCLEHHSIKVQMTNPILVGDVIDIGLLDKTFPDVPDGYFGDFLRGYFDGDGMISVCDSGYGKSIQTGFTDISLSFISSIRDILYDCGLTFVNVKRNGSNEKKCWRIRYSNEDSKKLFSILYNDSHSLFLRRKYDEFIRFVGVGSIETKGS